MYNYSKLVSSMTLRTITTSSILCGNHYDALGITPKATQSDIKSAYYKLSKVYHPDKAKDDDALKKFREITEAYEVLGNVPTKKLYDKGLLGGDNKFTRHHQNDEPLDPTANFYRSRARRHTVPTMDGTTPIYNFDSWSKEHYGELFEKQKYERNLSKSKQKKFEERGQASEQETVLYFMVFVGIFFMMFVLRGRSEFDIDGTKRNRQRNAQDSNKP